MTLPCIGSHHITDALIATAAAEAAGCDMAGIAEKLSGFGLDGLRQHKEYKKGQTVIIDCYNAAPDSMKAALNVLCDTREQGTLPFWAICWSLATFPQNFIRKLANMPHRRALTWQYATAITQSTLPRAQRKTEQRSITPPTRQKCLIS